MTDIAYALDRLVPGAEYRGSTTANTREAYNALVWLDARAKPSWDDIVANGEILPPTDAEIAAMVEDALSDREQVYAQAFRAIAEDLSALLSRLANGQTIPELTRGQILQRWKQYIANGRT